MSAHDTGPIECPHCGLRVALTRGVCPACKGDATDLREAPANRERARLAAAVRDLIGASKCRGVIRRVLIERGESAERVDAELRAQQWAYQSAAAGRGGRQLAIGVALIALAGVLIAARLGLLLALVALMFGGMQATDGLLRWRQSRLP